MGITKKMRPVMTAEMNIPLPGTLCPKCGSEIPEGKLYCESCGEEIRFVPEFEPEVDDSIASVMTDVAREIAHTGEETGGDKDYFDIHLRIPKKALRYTAVGIGIAAVITLAVIAIPHVLELKVFDRATRASEETATQQAEGNMPQAVSDSAQTETESEAGASIPQAPSISVSSGRYQGPVTVEITPESDDVRYYYTTDGSKPDDTKERYLGPIVIDSEGESTLRVVGFNEKGESGEETIAMYMIEPAAPDAPVILEDSGDYTQSTMIVAVMQENCRITYTTDKSEPTVDSTEYTSPIKMPVGNSVFRFRAFDADGVGSEIVERNYHLVYARLISEEQASEAVIRVLIEKNVLLDGSGKVLGQDGYNIYPVDSIIEIEGAGEYYRIVERYVQADGTTTDTGLLYAVNTNDGSVHRLGYDSSGNYTLFTLRNK
ncbi:MAG: chitobiase/beta-hexosaminidase C-terminal domain-containing protein [Lachnospiraceae bacterium]|nr:chitobiase/beta-hexosaminidase C-terminal domain-containing protein [Lachnospiraceae bacterium]